MGDKSMNEMQVTGNALATIGTLKAELVFVPGGVEAILTQVETTARQQAAVLDISTAKGRAAIKSLAAKVASSKTALDEMGKGLSDEWRKKADAIHAERRLIRDRLDALKEEVRKPVTDWENEEQARVEAHEKCLGDMAALGAFPSSEPSSSDIRAHLDLLRSDIYTCRNWQEFAKRAADLRAEIEQRLDRAYQHAVKRETEQAELERLRREQAERAQRERDERIAAEAAERARRAAEEKAENEARAAALAAARERERVEREKAEALARAEKAERDRVAAEEAAKLREQQAAEAAEKRRLQAIEDERQRVAAERAAQDAEAKRREADKAHRAKINGEALAALVAAGLSDAAAKTAVTAIAQGKVPHIRITY
jgi:hypothetical protein